MQCYLIEKRLSVVFILQVYGRTDLSNIQCSFNNQGIRELRQRNSILDGKKKIINEMALLR